MKSLGCLVGHFIRFARGASYLFPTSHNHHHHHRRRRHSFTINSFYTRVLSTIFVALLRDRTIETEKYQT